MARIGIVYWSGTGNTEQMAQLVAEGARAAGASVEVFAVSDTSASDVAQFDAVALGCPAMGDEALEEGEFEPFYEAFKALGYKKPVALFGSYSWAEGAWMQSWEEDARVSGLQLVNQGVIAFEAPEGEVAEACKKLGSQLVR